MQPCSQPRYGLTLVEKPTSGLSLCAIIDFDKSRRNSVFGEISSGPASGSRLKTSLKKRFAGLEIAPRPRIGSGLLVEDIAKTNLHKTCKSTNQSFLLRHRNCYLSANFKIAFH